MKYWKCSKCAREHITDELVIESYCSECLIKMVEVDHGERRTDN